MADYPEMHHLALRAVRRFDDWLLRDRNVTAVGVGHKVVAGEDTGEPCLTIFVARKLPNVPRGARLPRVLDIGGSRGIRTDVVEGGPFYQHQNTARIRPARPGTSIGEISVGAGTFGGIVTDNETGEELILSNNHVLADSNQAPIGSDIVQPGPADGGAAPADVVATLLRYIKIVPGQRNLVDAAVGRPISQRMILNDPLNGVPAPSPAHRAVGLLWGGDGSTWSALSVIQTVLTSLGVHFPAPDSVAPAAVGMAVQKTGRTTMKTTGAATAVSATVPWGGGATLYDQIITTKISEPGDSGSLVIEN